MRIRRVFASYFPTSARAAAAMLLAAAPLSAQAPVKPTAVAAAKTDAAAKEEAPAVADLVKKLESPHTAERLAAAEALNRLGADAAAAGPALAKALSDKYWPIRFEAAEALGNLGDAGAAAAPQLGKALSDSETAVRTAAAISLGRLGPQAAAALEAIEKAASDPDPQVHVRAIWALTRIEAAHPKLVLKHLPALLADLSSKVPGVSAEAVEVFGEIDAPAVPALAKLLAGDDRAAAALAAEALGEIGPEAKAAVPALTAALASPDGALVRNAAHALGNIGVASPEVLHGLLAALKVPREAPAVRAELAADLAKLARSARPAAGFGDLAAFAAAVEDADPQVRRGVLSAIARVAPKGPIFQRVLVRALKDKSEDVRIEAAAILASLDKETLAAMSAQVLPTCEASLADPQTRLSALLVIGHTGAAAKGCSSKILPLLAAEDPQTRLSALIALASVGADDEAALAAVAKLLDDPAPGVRNAAAYALGKAGAKASGSVAALEKLGASKEAVAQAVSAWALSRIEPTNAARLQTAVEKVVAGLCAADPASLPVFVEALAELKAEPKVVLAEVQKHLAHVDARRAGQVLRALASLGEHAVPALSEALSDPDVQHGAAAVLGGLGPAAAPAIPAMVKALASPDADFRSEILMAFGRIGPTSKPAFEAIAARLAASDAALGEQQAACYALGRLRTDAQGALPLLAEIMSGKKPGPKVAAAWATAGIAPKEAAADPAVVALLVEGLEDSRPVIRQTVAKALGELGKGAAAAAPALKALADDPDPGVVEAAGEALKQVSP